MKKEISSVEYFIKIQEALDGIYIIANDIDFSDYNARNCIITVIFTSKINGHTLFNLNNTTLFENFNGVVENMVEKL